MTAGVEELWVPAERVAPILDEYKGIVEHLSQRTARKINIIKTGGQQFVSLYVVDSMLVEMDLMEWLMLPQEQGGLADIYFDGKQYGKPIRSKQKYETDEERLEARRAVVRRRERKRGELVDVICHKCRTTRRVGKYYAQRMRPDAVCQKCSASAVGQIWAEHARSQIKKAA